MNFNVSNELKTQYICEAYEYTRKFFENQTPEVDEENQPSEEKQSLEEEHENSDDNKDELDTIVNSDETENETN